MNTQDKVVVLYANAAHVGTVVKVYKDSSIKVEWTAKDWKREERSFAERFTRYGDAFGAGRSGVAPSLRFVKQDEVLQQVAEINERYAQRQQERDQAQQEREAAQRQRMVAAAQIIAAAAKEMVETVAGPLHIYNLRTATRDGMVALVVKCTGKTCSDNEFYWAVAVAAETSMGAASEIAATADEAAEKYVAGSYA